MTRHLKTNRLTARESSGAYITKIAFGYGEDPVLVLELFDTDGRRVFVKLTQSHVDSIARTATRYASPAPAPTRE
jgi:hypothetical protein